MDDRRETADAICRVVNAVCQDVRKYVFGYEETAKLIAGAFIVGGHVLLEGPPGIAKTLLAKSFAHSLGLYFNRIQFTPDLMPSDVTGVYIFDQSSASFRFAAGPIFSDIVLADEINRTPPKTQSALLEAMQEHFVTIDGTRHALGEMFFVIATQNPIEHEGTFPLPEAQLDRFLFKLTMGYPSREHETSMIHELSSLSPELADFHPAAQRDNKPMPGVVSRKDLQEARVHLRQILLDASISDYIQRLAAGTREHPDLALGASPRAALNLALASKLSAALDGREYVIPDDVKGMCPLVFSHRLVLQPEIVDTNSGAEKLVAEVLSRVPVPQNRMM